jgi:AraC-like DNA-binding protein
MSKTPAAAAERPAGARAVPAVYLRLVLDACGPRDAPARRELLTGTGLEDPLQQSWPATVPREALERLLHNAALGRPSGWHLGLVMKLDAAVHGALGFAVLSAPTLAAAVDVLLTYGGTRMPFLTFALQPAGSRVRLVLAAAGQATTDDGWVLEVASMAVANLVAQFTARDPREVTILLPGSPRPHAAMMASVTPASVAFGRRAFGVEWPRSWQSLSSHLSDEGLHRLSVERCREQLARLSGRTPLEEAIRQAVLAAGGRPPGLAALAAARNVAPRSLMRHLREAGTSYQRIVDEVRADLAMGYLKDTRLPLAVIAERLGFSDTSNFSRAFRSWFGRSPGSCRS